MTNKCEQCGLHACGCVYGLQDCDHTDPVRVRDKRIAELETELEMWKNQPSQPTPEVLRALVNAELLQRIEMLGVENVRLGTENDRLEAELASTRNTVSSLDCRYSGKYADSSGSHCPLGSPCLRCRLEAEVAELNEAMADILTDARSGVCHCATAHIEHNWLQGVVRRIERLMAATKGE